MVVWLYDLYFCCYIKMLDRMIYWKKYVFWGYGFRCILFVIVGIVWYNE